MTTDIIIQENLPLLDPEMVVTFFNKLQGLKDKILKIGEDYQITTKKDGTRLVTYNRSGFNKLAMIFGISTDIIKERRYTFKVSKINPETEKPIKKEYYGYEITVKAIRQNGIFCVDGGNCSSNEDKPFKRGRHDVRAVAITRARERSIAGLVGGGLSLDEIDGDSDFTQSKPPQQSKKIIIRPRS